MDHVPPKQFYPKERRANESPNLQVAATHGACNEDYRKDEEYFYHCMYPLVQQSSKPMGDLILNDFRRRSSKPQTPAMLRRLLNTCTTVTPGGIHLPHGVIQLQVDEYRIQRVALKVTRGLFHLDTGRYMPQVRARDIRLCLDEPDVIDLYRLSWQATPMPSGVDPSVFSYRYFELDGLHLWSMLF